MDKNRVTFVARSLTSVPSRRDVVRGLLGAGFVLGAAQLPDVAAAKKRKKKNSKPKPAKPNAFGCLNVGVVCKNADQCCSGVCEGGMCRAHDAGFCRVDYDLCTTGAAHVCGIDGAGDLRCVCVLTTGNAPFCADFSSPMACRDCSQDTDCEEEFGPGAACVVNRGICEGACPETGDTACVPPCAKPAK